MFEKLLARFTYGFYYHAKYFSKTIIDKAVYGISQFKVAHDQISIW